MRIKEIQEDLSINRELRKLQLNDKKVKRLIEEVKDKSKTDFIMEDGVLLKLRKARSRRLLKQLIVPDCLKNDVFKICHDSLTGAYLSQKKIWTKLNNRFFCENSYKDTIDYVRSCQTCAKFKNSPPNRANLMPIFEKPFDKVGVDILELRSSNSGNKYVIVFTDYLTKLIEAFPLRDIKAETIAVFTY